LTAASSSAQSRADISAIGGGGVATGEDQRTAGALSAGASFGFPYSARHRLQFDYLLTHINDELRAPEIGLDVPDADTRNQFLTASWVLQSRGGRARPFFQAGGGIVHRRYHTASTYFEGSTVVAIPMVETDTSLAIFSGAGATIDLGESLFIRPMVRLYMHVGPTFTFMPAVALGYRF
jgi:hypothetical protein